MEDARCTIAAREGQRFRFRPTAGTHRAGTGPGAGHLALAALDRGNGGIAHRSIADLPDLLTAGDLLVVNNTRVFPARLLGQARSEWGRRRVSAGRARRTADCRWRRTVGSARSSRSEAEARGACPLRRSSHAPRRDSRTPVLRPPGRAPVDRRRIAGPERGRRHRPHTTASVHPAGRRRETIASGIRRCSPGRVVRLPRRPPACTSRPRCSRRWPHVASNAWT